MIPDLNLHAVLIDAEHLQDLDWVYQSEPMRVAPCIDLDDLAIEVDWKKKRTIWALYGSCDLSAIQEVLRRISDCSKAVLLEAEAADAYHLTYAERERLRQMMRDGRLSLVAGGSLAQRADKLLAQIDIDCMDGWKPVLSTAQIRQRPQEVRELFERLAAGINLKVMGKATHLQVTLPYLRNALINAPLAWEDPRLTRWQDLRKDRPVLIVASGPSLNKQLPLLAENQDLFTIISVDTAWPILKAQGIVPDAILALDPESVPSWPRNAMADTTAFCVDLGCGPSLVWSNDRNHIMTGSNFAVYQIMKELGVKVSLLSTGGSVATSAFALAERLGANPIVFIGQDLALTHGKDHADGYPAAYNTELLSQRTESGFDVEGYHGGRLRTERQLLFYKNWFEGRIQALQDRLIINATEGGARIQGALQLPFSAVCQEIRATALRKAPLFEPFVRTIDPEHMQGLRDGLGRLRKGIESFAELAAQGRALCRRMGRRPSKKQLARLDQLNEAIRTHQPASKAFVDVLCMVQVDRIRYKTHIRDGMDDLSDAVRRYDEIYANIASASLAAEQLLDRIDVFYARVSECKVVDPALLHTLLPDAEGPTP